MRFLSSYGELLGIKNDSWASFVVNIALHLITALNLSMFMLNNTDSVSNDTNGIYGCTTVSSCESLTQPINLTWPKLYGNAVYQCDMMGKRTDNCYSLQLEAAVIAAPGADVFGATLRE